MKNIARLISLVCIPVQIIFGQNTMPTIEDLFNQQTKQEDIHQATIKVFSKPKQMDIEYNYGNPTISNSEPLPVPFYTASIGKIFTAVSIGILKDQGKLKFNDLISKYLPENMVRNLHVLDGVHYGKTITIAQLLQHTSGLPDYFEDQPINGESKIIDQLFIYPNKKWTPEELLTFTENNLTPKFKPGEDYYYTDTEYLLLALIIEEISGMSLHEFYKQHIFIPFNLQHTYLNLKSKPLAKTAPMAGIYAETFEISNYKSLSADWGGGGIISTNSDLITFLQALFNHKIVKKKTLNAMQNWTKETLGMYYGFGLRKIEFNQLDSRLKPYSIIGHSGATGSFLYYCPQLDVYISGTLNQSESTQRSVLLVYEVLNSIENNK